MRLRIAACGGLPHHRAVAAPTFKDHFSRQSADYSRYRPGYPPELIEWVCAQAPDRALAVDCAREMDRQPSHWRSTSTPCWRSTAASPSSSTHSRTRACAINTRWPSTCPCPTRPCHSSPRHRPCTGSTSSGFTRSAAASSSRVARSRLDLREVSRQPGRGRGAGPVLRGRDRAVLGRPSGDTSTRRMRRSRSPGRPSGCRASGCRPTGRSSRRSVTSRPGRPCSATRTPTPVRTRCPPLPPSWQRFGLPAARFVSTGPSTCGWVETDCSILGGLVVTAAVALSRPPSNPLSNSITYPAIRPALTES